MTKTQRFKSFIVQNQIAPAENLDAILSCIDSNQEITFFSWKMFELGNLNFDTKSAKKYLSREKRFVSVLNKLGVKYKYIKLIPDELPKYFYAQKSPEAKLFSKQVTSFFSKNLTATKTIQMTELLSSARTQCPYSRIFNFVYRNFDKLVDNSEFEKEIVIRNSPEVAKRAFCLFAAESAVIYKFLKNPVLLAGRRSINTYKYEFYRYPKNRPVLPKLFVI